MVAFDEVHELAHRLEREGFSVQTLAESFLTLEGVVRAINANPPRFGKTADEAKAFFQSFMARGFLPLSTKKSVDGVINYVFGICAHNLEMENRPLRSPEEILILFDEAKNYAGFPFTHDNERISFVLISSALSGEGSNQYSELCDANVVLDEKARDLYLRGINADSSAMESFFAMLKFAISHRASDIHIEPDPNLSEAMRGTGLIKPVGLPSRKNGKDNEDDQQSGGRVRYRVDGVLITPDHILTRSIIRKAVAIIKSMANIPIQEHRLPQDGRITFSAEDIQKLPQLVEYDLRVSILPTVHGEKAQLRLMRKQAFNKVLDECGFEIDVLGRLKRKLREPKGIILVTGPTGSGKTTSLYAALNEINDGKSNIVTVEDPVESIQPGINQVQVDEKIGLTYSSVMRSILRQDPNKIFLGEIRDEDSAKNAVRMAITGHLLLSTMHVDCALDVIMRLEGLGVSGVYIASALLAVVSQRLVRKICPNCREEYDGYEELKNLWGRDLFGDKVKLFRAVPGRACNICGGIGYAQMMLLAEFYAPSQIDRRIMASGELDFNIYFDAAIKQGFQPMSYVAMRAILNGQTDLAEVLRAAVTVDEFLRDGQLIARHHDRNKS